MKHFSFVAVVFMLFASCFGCPAQALEPSTSGTLTRCSSEELANLYRQAGARGDIQLKRRIAEEIGERGAKDFAQNRGWDPILTKAEKSAGHPQGFDQVWQGNDGKIHVIEAKGGESYLSTGKSGTQGTTEWCVKAAEKTLKNHAATEAEKSAARTVLKAASNGNLDIYVVQTPHVQGAAGNTVCKEVGECTQEATRLSRNLMSRNTAQSFESGAEVFSRNASYSVETVGKGVSKTAKSATQSLTKASTAVEMAAGVGLAVDAGLRAKDAYDTEQRYRNGEIDNHERVVSHVKNGAGMAGGWGGAAAGGYAGATGGAAAGAAVGSVVPVVGTAIGGAVGGAIGGVGGAIGGYFFGEKAAEAGVDCADGYFYGN